MARTLTAQRCRERVARLVAAIRRPPAGRPDRCSGSSQPHGRNRAFAHRAGARRAGSRRRGAAAIGGCVRQQPTREQPAAAAALDRQSSRAASRLGDRPVRRQPRSDRGSAGPPDRCAGRLARRTHACRSPPETANTYVGLRTCQLQLGIAENDARSRAETARLADLSERAGFTAPATAALARAGASEGAARARQQRAEVRDRREGAGRPDRRARNTAAWQVDRAQCRAARTAVLMNVQSVPAQVLAQRPDVYQAELEVAAASADVGDARAQRYPRLSLTGSIAAGMVRIGGEATSAQTWAIGPLAQRACRSSTPAAGRPVNALRHAYVEAAALYHARVRQAVREVEEALVTLDSTRARRRCAAGSRWLSHLLRRNRSTLARWPGQPGGTGRHAAHAARGRAHAGRAATRPLHRLDRLVSCAGRRVDPSGRADGFAQP